MELVYKSRKIKDPDVNLINDIRETIFWLENTSEDTRDCIIKMNGVLCSVLQSMILGGKTKRLYTPLVINGCKCYEDNSIKAGVYCVYRQDKIKPIPLTPIKTLDEWFTNLPLIYKIDLYNSISGTITKHLK